MRRERSLTLLVLVAVVLLAPATAQGPGPTTAVSIAMSSDTAEFSLDKAAEFTATVKNTGQASGTPLDAQNEGDVVVDVTGVPDGWAVNMVPTHFSLVPGAAQTVTFTVSAAADSADNKATLTVTATLTSPIEGLDPILGQIPQGSQTAQASDTIEVTRSDSVTRGVLEAIGSWIYAILLVMVAAVMVAVALTVAGRRAMVRLTADATDLPVPAGGRVAFPLQIEGLGKETDTVLLQVSAVPTGWAAFLPVPELVLEPRGIQELTLMVISPSDAAIGTRQSVLVTATSAKAPRGEASIEFVAIVEAGPGKPAAAAAAPKRRK